MGASVQPDPDAVLTPVVYLYLDRLGQWGRQRLPAIFHAIARAVRPARSP
ncbi:hypothetical protein RAA17_14950 [Komagataeibacter rhaeticus]|nr:hypothetical protein [Komagataeibacter rhaeticus]